MTVSSVASTPQSASAAFRLLLVEDNPGDVELARERLSSVPDYSFDLTCVTSLQDAIGVLERSHVDAVVLDLTLPDSSGIETLRRLRAVRQDVAIVVLSGGAGEDLRRLALREGAQDFIGKNEAPALLLARIMPSAFERHRAQEHHRQVEQLVGASPDAVIVTDTDGIVQFVNAAALELFGRPSDQFLGRPLDLPIDHAEVSQIEIPANGGVRSADVRVAPCEWGHRPARLVSIRDTTDRKLLEEQLRQALKLEAIGQLTGGVAHDFNNILTVITGTIDILANAVGHDAKLSAIARMIDDAATRAADLTRHLLAFARKQPLHPRLTDVNELIVDAAKLLRPTLGEQVEIESKLDETAWPALVDPSQLTTALLNLAFNSRDAMPDGGKLTFQTGNVVLDDAYAAGNLDVRPGAYLMIAVSDTGSGIPAAVLDQVFMPFFTTKKAGRGTGLGLSMVYGFVKQSDGHVKIYSEEGCGTIVRIYLPHATGEVGAAIGPADAAPAGGTESILVVEDDALVRDYVTVQLQNLGYRTAAAANAAEALQLLDDGGAFDLLFTDVIIPGGVNGRQLAEEAARRLPAIRVLFTSGYTEDVIVHNGRLDPGVVLLSKPYRKIELARQVRAVLDGKPAGLI